MDEQIKAQATETLAAMGLSVSDAVRVVADKQMPFALKAPNAETRAAMAEADAIAHIGFERHAAGTQCVKLFKVALNALAICVFHAYAQCRAAAEKRPSTNTRSKHASRRAGP